MFFLSKNDINQLKLKDLIFSKEKIFFFYDFSIHSDIKPYLPQISINEKFNFHFSSRFFTAYNRKKAAIIINADGMILLVMKIRENICTKILFAL